jgi:ATP-dependent Clp protease ATP-binding subunit ClpA
MLSRNLEKSLHRALAHANDRRHEFAILEHLLLALTEDQDAVAVLRACSVDLDRLRRELLTYVDNELGNLVAAHKDTPSQRRAFSACCSARYPCPILWPWGGHRRERDGRHVRRAR